MQQLAIGLLVVVMMIAIGLRTETGDFAAVWRRPAPLLVGIAINVIVVPAAMVLATRGLNLAPEVTVGIVLCAASPGGPTGPLFAAQAGGHLATAIVGMIALTFASVATAPPTITAALDVTVAVDASSLLLPMTGTLVAFQLVPLAFGMLVRRVRHDLAQRASGPANAIANALLLVVIVGLLLAKGRVLATVGVVALVAIVAMVLLNVALGAVTPGGAATRRSWAIVTGVRNISLALLVAARYFDDPLTDATILTFGLFTMVVPFVIARVLGRRAVGAAAERTCPPAA